jgi:hypothetical protein
MGVMVHFLSNRSSEGIEPRRRGDIGDSTFERIFVGQASRLPSNDLRSQARRLRYFRISIHGLGEVGFDQIKSFATCK